MQAEEATAGDLRVVKKQKNERAERVVDAAATPLKETNEERAAKKIKVIRLLHEGVVKCMHRMF